VLLPQDPNGTTTQTTVLHWRLVKTRPIWSLFPNVAPELPPLQKNQFSYMPKDGLQKPSPFDRNRRNYRLLFLIKKFTHVGT